MLSSLRIRPYEADPMSAVAQEAVPEKDDVVAPSDDCANSLPAEPSTGVVVEDIIAPVQQQQQAKQDNDRTADAFDKVSDEMLIAGVAVCIVLLAAIALYALNTKPAPQHTVHCVYIPSCEAPCE